MGEKNSLFVWSGVCAIVLYCLVIFLLLWKLSSIFTTKYTSRINTTIEQAVSIDIVPTELEQIKDTNSGTHLEGTGLKDIFSTIPDIAAPSKEAGDNRSKNAKNTKNKGDNSRLQNIQNQIEKLNATLSSMGNKMLDMQAQSASIESTDGEYNEWFAKIYDILYQRWQPKYYQDADVSVLLRITDTGSLHYRITRLSRYDDYNQSVIALLESLKHEDLPPYSKGRSVEVEVNFKLK